MPPVTKLGPVGRFFVTRFPHTLAWVVPKSMIPTPDRAGPSPGGHAFWLWKIRFWRIST